jgi:hypothetical protein
LSPQGKHFVVLFTRCSRVAANTTCVFFFIMTTTTTMMTLMLLLLLLLLFGLVCFVFPFPVFLM